MYTNLYVWIMTVDKLYHGLDVVQLNGNYVIGIVVVCNIDKKLLYAICHFYPR